MLGQESRWPAKRLAAWPFGPPHRGRSTIEPAPPTALGWMSTRGHRARPDRGREAASGDPSSPLSRGRRPRSSTSQPRCPASQEETSALFGLITRCLASKANRSSSSSHKLREVLAVATGSRDAAGRSLATCGRPKATPRRLAEMIVGRSVIGCRPSTRTGAPRAWLCIPAKPTLRTTAAHRQATAISSAVRAARSSGSRALRATGRRSWPRRSPAADPSSRALSGSGAKTSRPRLPGVTSRPVSATSPRTRQRRGLVLEYSIAENLALHDYRSPPASRYGWLFPRRLVERARSLIREFDVRGGGPATRAGGLSGGNEQKVVLAREIDRDPKDLIAAQPTRGLDVGAIEFVHRRLIEERDEGRAILLVSLELEEVLSLSDRVLVMYEGEIAGEFPPTASEEELGIAMTGGGRQRSRRVSDVEGGEPARRAVRPAGGTATPHPGARASATRPRPRAAGGRGSSRRS